MYLQKKTTLAIATLNILWQIKRVSQCSVSSFTDVDESRRSEEKRYSRWKYCFNYIVIRKKIRTLHRFFIPLKANTCYASPWNSSIIFWSYANVKRTNRNLRTTKKDEWRILRFLCSYFILASILMAVWQGNKWSVKKFDVSKFFSFLV